MLMQGKLEDISLLNVLQSLTVLGISADVHLRTAHGEGEVFIRGGTIVNARFAGKEGEEALALLLSQRQGEFDVQAASASVPRKIQKPAHELLLDLSRKLEEGRLPEVPTSPFEGAPETVQYAFQNTSSLEFPLDRLALTAVKDQWSGVLQAEGSEGQGTMLLYKGNLIYARWKTPLEQVLTDTLAVSYANRVCEEVEHLLSFAQMPPRMVWAVLPLYEETREGDTFQVKRIQPGAFLDFLVQRHFSGALKVILPDREAAVLFFEGSYLGTFDLSSWAAFESPFEVLTEDAFAQLYTLQKGKRKTLPWKSRERVYPVYEIQQYMEDLNTFIKHLTMPYIKKYSYRSLVHSVERAIEESGFPGTFKSEDKRLVVHHLRNIPHEKILSVFRRLYESLARRAREEIGKKEVSKIEKELKKRKSPLVPE